MLSSPYAKLAQYRPFRRPGRVRDPRRGRVSDGRPAGPLVRRYILALALLAACIVVAAPFAVILYPALGIWLSRAAGARIAWSQHRATVDAVAQAKLQMIMRWPVALPTLIVQLWIAHTF